MDSTEQQMTKFVARLKCESIEAYEASPFAALSRDCFSRYWFDPDVEPGINQIAIDGQWTIVCRADGRGVCRLMAEHLRDFLARCMNVSLKIVVASHLGKTERVIMLDEHGGGASQSFSIEVVPERVVVAGAGTAALRDGVVMLVDRIGMRRAPILSIGQSSYRPRLGVRLGTIPHRGSVREAVFLGHNALTMGWFDLYELSESDAIPPLSRFREVDRRMYLAERVADARRYELATYAHVELRKLPGDDPVFAAHPELRGALTWKADGEYVLCTEHPLMQQYLSETTEGLFRAVPDLDGINIIIGGESFYHCFMRPHGQRKGHTNCPRCEALGPYTVVANLVNRLGAAARRASPTAEIVVWPYSASGVWSDDPAQLPFIERLEKDFGVVLLTEMEKEEHVTTPSPHQVRKHLWDYSIHLIGPGERAAQQIDACRRNGIPIYMKSEAEIAMECPRLPHIPCLDRWQQRAEAIAACGADGAWVFPNFRPLYGSSAVEIFKQRWWSPAVDAELTLEQLAARIAGRKAGPHLRNAWRLVSEAMAYSPELPPYYSGTTYLGPAHPMCCDPNAALPPVFLGRYLFTAEHSFQEGMRLRSTCQTDPRGEDVAAFEGCYRSMADLLARAAAEIDAADPFVPAACRLQFAAEASPIHWFYRTVQTTVNFYKSCAYRNRFFSGPQREDPQSEPRPLDAAIKQNGSDGKLVAEWRQVLLDEQENATAALPLAEADVRLDFHYGGDHCFSHTTDMIRAKLELLEYEIQVLK